MSLTARRLIEMLQMLPPDLELDFREVSITKLSGQLAPKDPAAIAELRIVLDPAGQRAFEGVVFRHGVSKQLARRLVDQLAGAIDGDW
jgi:hypothetical protein